MYSKCDVKKEELERQLSGFVAATSSARAFISRQEASVESLQICPVTVAVNWIGHFFGT